MAMPRQSRLLTYDGRTQSLKEWAKEIGISEDTLRRRLDERGLPVWLALTMPPKGARDRRRGICKKCRYMRHLNRWKSEIYCGYIEATGHRRPCSFADCPGWPKNEKSE